MVIITALNVSFVSDSMFGAFFFLSFYFEAIVNSHAIIHRDGIPSTQFP